MEDHFKKYIKLRQHDNNKDRFHDVPIGKATNNLLSSMNISTHITIHFHDNTNNKCVTNALAPVLYYLRESKYANMIYKFGKKIENKTGRLAIDSIIQYWNKMKNTIML